MALWRIRAVIPCYNRRNDLLLLLSDLAALDTGVAGGIDLSVTVVDNASDPPLTDLPRSPTGGFEVLRLDRNQGGSGGFNAGMGAVLGRGIAGDACEFVWLLDSDARVERGALLPLLEALERDPGLAAAGSVLVDPASGRVFEGGGRVNPRTGEYEQPWEDDFGRRETVEADYLAACSVLVRRSVIEQAGPMADFFLNGDDVEWSARVRRRTGMRLAAVPASRAIHPHPDRMRTGARYYAARNAFAVLGATGAGRWARLARAVREVGRAAAQALVGRDDLAELHLRGMADALAGTTGPAPEGSVRFDGWRAANELPGALRQVLALNPPRGRVMVREGLVADMAGVSRALNAVCVEPLVLAEAPAEEQPGLLAAAARSIARLMVGPPWSVAVVSARARPDDWLVARAIATVGPEGFVLRRVWRPELALRTARLLARGAWLSAALAWRQPREPVVEYGRFAPARPLSLSVVILSYNRWSVLARTLGALLADPSMAGAEVIVVDNGSTDGSAQRVRERFPRVRLVALDENLGVEAFNRGVATASGEALLILDDDATPAEGAIERALDLLSRRPELGAVALHPRHPESRASEWPFGEGRSPCDDWPVMGCANLVRRAAWARVGGYCPQFFLYRNDTDLAMSLLEAGWGVHFDPALVAWHDSPAAAKKSVRWFELATRNWVWLCRRHGRGLSAVAAAALGWAHAHLLAGRDCKAHLAVLKGVQRGVRERPPEPTAVLRPGGALRSLLRLRLWG